MVRQENMQLTCMTLCVTAHVSNLWFQRSTANWLWVQTWVPCWRCQWRFDHCLGGTGNFAQSGPTLGLKHWVWWSDLLPTTDIMNGIVWYCLWCRVCRVWSESVKSVESVESSKKVCCCCMLFTCCRLGDPKACTSDNQELHTYLFQRSIGWGWWFTHFRGLLTTSKLF